jgi:voltage-gated potassium channel
MEFTIAFIQLFTWSIYLVLPLLAFLGLLIVVLGLCVCQIEKWNRFDALYWSFITATTVGYGDIRPLKKLSKVLSVLIAIVGMMLTGLIIAITIRTASIAFEKHADVQTIETMKQKLNYKGDK